MDSYKSKIEIPETLYFCCKTYKKSKVKIILPSFLLRFRKADGSFNFNNLHIPLPVNQLLLRGKRKPYLCIVIILGCVCGYTTIEIMQELKRNVSKFDYGINFKYEGTLSHSFDRFYVVTKFELPKLEDLKLTTISYESDCQYLDNARNLKDYPTELI